MVSNFEKKKLILFLFTILIANISYAQGYICAIGGGSEDYSDWSDEPYSWIVSKSNFGKIVVLSANDETNWIPNYFMSFGADTAFNIKVNSKSKANLQTIFDEVISAKAIFIKGGDQWDYVRLWKNTLLDSAIMSVFKNGGVVAGTSAGAAVLGQSDFSAKNGTVYSDEALQNPFNNYMQFENDFLNLVDGVIFDSHLTERARQGRLLTFLYNNYFNNNSDLLGIGIDDATALCIYPNGIAEVTGSGCVLFVHKENDTEYFSFENNLTIENLHADQLIKGWKYNLNNRSIEFIPPTAHTINFTEGVSGKNKLVLFSGLELSNPKKELIKEELINFVNKKVLIISNEEFESNALVLNEFLDSISINSNFIFINDASLNSNENYQKIENADYIILFSDSLNIISKLADSSFVTAIAFKNYLDQNKPVMFIGNCGKLISEKFMYYNKNDIYASYYGRMKFSNGLNIADDFVFQPAIFNNSDFYENDISSVFWNMAKNQKKYGLFLNGNDKIEIDLSNLKFSGECITPYIFVDASNSTHFDFSNYKASGNSGNRQIAAMNNISISLSNNPDFIYLISERKYDVINSIEKSHNKNIKHDLILDQNFPNPFNPSTTIRFELEENSHVVLKIYDIIGKEISTLINDNLNKGNHEAIFESKILPSGIYFYTLKTNNSTITKSMVLLK